MTNVEVSAGQGVFKTQGKILRFDGYRRVLPPGGKQEDALLPALNTGQTLDLLDLNPTQHFTQPPPRYSEATLIKALEKENIGRPSTYAPIIQTIQDRKYVEQKERRFFATELGMVVTDLLVEHFPKILDLKFTAQMEDELDEVAEARMDWVKVLDEFYGPFQASLSLAETQMQKVQITSDEICHKCGAPMLVKYSKGEAFLSCSKYPECKATRSRDGSVRVEAVETEHACPKCGKPLMLREGKRGPFMSCSGFPGCKESFNIDADGNPVPSVIETEHACPKCGKPMALRQGARGAFLGCTGYPKCRTTMPVGRPGQAGRAGPGGRQVREVREGRWASSRGGEGPSSAAWPTPNAAARRPSPTTSRRSSARRPWPPPAAAAGAVDLKTIEVAETCEQCGSSMTVRKGRRGYFLGCSGYPKCKGTKGARRGHPGEDHGRDRRLIASWNVSCIPRDTLESDPPRRWSDPDEATERDHVWLGHLRRHDPGAEIPRRSPGRLRI